MQYGWGQWGVVRAIWLGSVGCRPGDMAGVSGVSSGRYCWGQGGAGVSGVSSCDMAGVRGVLGLVRCRPCDMGGGGIGALGLVSVVRAILLGSAGCWG